VRSTEANQVYNKRCVAKQALPTSKMSALSEKTHLSKRVTVYWFSVNDLFWLAG
jgi:hypothetical protein